MNHPDWNPIARLELTWDGVVSSLDRPDVRKVFVVTEGGGNGTQDNRTALFQGMEDGLQIPDEISLDCTTAHGLTTEKGVAQMYEYLVYGHGDSWYAEEMSYSYKTDLLFLSGRTRETESYWRL